MASVGSTIFIDLDDDGINNEAAAYVTTTAANGTWSFVGLGPEVIGHNVLEVQQGGFIQTLGQAGHLVSGDATDLNFANFELFESRAPSIETSTATVRSTVG